MTEAEWLACTDPTPMLKFLRGRASARKLRLFACACCRRIWRLLTSEPRGWVEIAEQFADGMVHQPELDKAAAIAKSAVGGGRHGALATNDDAFSATCAVMDSMDDTSADLASTLGANAVANERIRGEKTFLGWDGSWKGERDIHTHLLRDIVGNPFRPVTLDPAWQNPTVVALARAAYDNRILPDGTMEPARLAILSDALEEAGCINADILAHFRGAGPHVWGCWAVDLVLSTDR